MDNSKRPRVLCVDDDRDIAEVVQAALVDEGYDVSCIYDASTETVTRAVGMLEPDCVLLDGGGHAEFGSSWADAAALYARRRSIPVVMFTAHTADSSEAARGVTDRAIAAHFAAVLPKPFEIDMLLAAVAKAVGRSEPFERGAAAEERRTRELVAALRDAGASDIHPSSLREWATFRNSRGDLTQLYWWQARGVYQIGRFREDGTLRMLGQVADRDAAIELAMGTR